MGPAPVYDEIDRTYARTRRADPRVAARIRAAVGSATSVLNVGAGTGNYEPDDIGLVVALEPSRTMIDQRRPGTAPAVQGVAEHLPFVDGAFDVAMGSLTLHHWRDLVAGLAEVRRVSRRQVFFFFDTDVSHELWLIDDYFPAVKDLPSEQPPTAAQLARHLEVDRVEVVAVPADCTDGFGGAHWNRPERYLDDDVLAGMSFTALLDPTALEAGVERLRADLHSGAWDARWGHLRSMSELDLGYRLLVAGDTAG